MAYLNRSIAPKFDSGTVLELSVALAKSAKLLAASHLPYS